MFRSDCASPADNGVTIGSAQDPVISSAIGKIQTAIGSVTIARANAIVAHPAIGGLVYEGDLIETGIDGQVGLVFVDGTTFHLYASTRLVLNEFIYGADKSSNSARLNVAKGMFGCLAGKIATIGRLIIDTPLAKIQNAAPASGFGLGSLTFSALIFCVVREAEAASLDISYVDDGKIAYKDLVHGWFEVDTIDGKHYVVDDPEISLALQMGLGGTNATTFTNSATQMAQYQAGYQDAFSTLSQAIDQHFLDANPGSTNGSGSGSSPGNNNPQLNGLIPIIPISGTNTQDTTSTSSGSSGGFIFVPPPPPQIIHYDAHWINSSGGDWNTAANWNTNAVPSPFASIAIDAPGQYFVTSNTNVSIGNLLIGAGATLNLAGNGTFSITNAVVNIASADSTLVVAAGSTLTIDPTTIVNAGTLDDAGTLDLTDVTMFNTGGTVQIDPGATLDFVDSIITGGTLTVAGLFNSTGTSIIANAAITIANTTGTLESTGGKLAIGSGTISNAGTLEANGGELDLSGVTTFTNSGLLLATASSLLVLNGDTVDNTGGTVQVNASSTVNLQSAIINHGTITNAGLLEATGGSTSTIENATSFTNDGELLSTGVGTTLVLNGETITNTLNGTDGTVQVDANATFNLQNAIINYGTVTNHGLLEATGGTSSTIENVTSFSNDGQLEATGGSLLVLNSETVTNTSGTIKFDATSTGTVSGTTINGGTVTNNGTLNLTGGDTIENGTLGNSSQINVSGTDALSGETVTNTGTLELLGAGALTLSNDQVTNTNGTIKFDATSTGTVSGTTINGGSLTVAGLFDSSGTSFINNAAVTITGTGTLESTGGKLTIDPSTINNAGTLEANGGELDLTGDTITNTGKLLATDNSLLLLNGDTITNTGGTVQVDNGSTLDLENVIITGGTLSGAGTITALSGDSTLNNVTVANGTNVTANGGTLDLTGTITLNGEIDAGTSAVDLENVTINGGTLGGSGTIATQISGSDSTLNNVTIRFGTTVTASAGTTLDLTNLITNNGEIDAATGGTIDLESVTIVGGTLSGPGTIATVSGADTLNGVAIASGTTIKVTDNTALDLKGTIVNSGTIALNSSGDFTQLKISGNVSLNGASGHMTLTDNINNFIVSDGLAATLTNSNTITGAGTIGDTLLTLVNNGTIDATGTHALIIDTGINTPTGAGLVGNLTVINNAGAILEASAGSTLDIDDNVTNFGVIAALAAVGSAIATVDITGNVSGTGSLEIFNKASLEIGGSVSSGETVFFENGQSKLILDTSKQFSGLITGSSLGVQLTSNDLIDFKDLQFISGHMSETVTYDSTTNISTVVFSDGTLANTTILLSGNYTNDSWVFTSDGSGVTPGTLVELAPTDHWINSSGGVWNVATNWSLGAAPTSIYNVVIDAPGTYTITSTTNVEISSLVVDAGVTLLGEPGTTFTIDSNVTNNGTIEAGPFNANQISIIDLEGNVSGTGLLEISNKGIIEVGGSVAAGEVVLFIAGQGELILDHSAQFDGLIESSAQGTKLSTGNLIDLRDLPFANGMSATVSYDSTTNISHLTFSNGIIVIPDILFLGDYSHSSWTLTSDGSGGTMVADPPDSGTATIDSGTTLDIVAASAESISFANNAGTSGALVLNDSVDFTGVIYGFAGDGTLSNSDYIDLKDIDFSHLTIETYTENSAGTGGTLTLSDGTHTTNIDFAGNYVFENFTLSNDGSGGTLIIDPPVTSTETVTIDSGTTSDSGSSGGTQIIDSSVTSTETTTIDSGTTLDIAAASTESVSFANHSGTTGSLVLNDSIEFSGVITGFAGDGTPSNSDSIDLKDIGFSSLTTETYTENSAGTGGTLTLSDGTHTANINFAGNYVLENFKFSNDGSGGTLIIDPSVESTGNEGSVGGTVGTGPSGTITSTGLQPSPHPLDQHGLFAGLSGDQGFSFKFDTVHSPTSNLSNISGILDHIELEHPFKSELNQLQSLLQNAADGQPHDLSGQAEGIHIGSVQLSHLNYHPDGILHS